MLTPAGNSALNSSCPRGRTPRRRAGCPSRRTGRRRGVVCALPCDAATSPSGWSSDATSVARGARWSSLTVTARLVAASSAWPRRLVVEERVHRRDRSPRGRAARRRSRPRRPASCPGAARSVKLAGLAAELPDDAAGVPVDLVGRPGVARVDQQVAVAVEVHGVDVEPVPRGARPTRAAAARSAP